MTDINPAPLLEEIVEQQKRFDAFVVQSRNSLLAARGAAEDARLSKEAELERLEAAKLDLATQRAALASTLSAKNDEIDAVLQEARLLQETAAAEAPVRLGAKASALQEATAELTAARADADAKRAGRELRKNELSKGVTFYKERLGLAFERMPDNSLSFRLTLIDPENPDRAFAFSVAVNKANKYEVTKCEPRVEYGALLTKLNADNNFSVFVQQMRRRFQSLC